MTRNKEAVHNPIMPLHMREKTQLHFRKKLTVSLLNLDSIQTKTRQSARRKSNGGSSPAIAISPAHFRKSNAGSPARSPSPAHFSVQSK